MPNPYQGLPDKAYWRTAVADVEPLRLAQVYRKKFDISPTDRIATAGSCFAQHIGKRLARSGFNYIETEAAPPLLPAEKHAAYGYGIYSARYANIYTVAQLSQLFDRAFKKFKPTETVWETGGRFYDPFRPNIEPNGFATPEEVETMRISHLQRVRRMFSTLDLFVFTLGLTEAWVNREDGAVYPVCPGTVAGTFDPGKYAFHNFSFTEIFTELQAFIGKLREVNPGARLLLTVSPVPLTATASDDHVMVASSYSKSVLRAVAGETAQADPLIDYYPSYELVSAHPMRAMFFEPNMRSVSPSGVDHVLSYFFDEHPAPQAKPVRKAAPRAEDDDVVCEEELLAAMQGR